MTVPECDMAIATHAGNHNDVDRSYGALASFVAEYAVGVDGPIRVFYLVGSRQSTDESRWRTEIGWPIFKTEHDPSSIPLVSGRLATPVLRSQNGRRAEPGTNTRATISLHQVTLPRSLGGLPLYSAGPGIDNW